jgi:cyanophycinase
VTREGRREDSVGIMIVYFTRFVMFTALAALIGGIPIGAAQAAGPEKGWLIIHGGGAVSKEVQERFVALAGGPDANFVLIPTAMTNEEIALGGFFRWQGARWAKSWGIKHVTMLHATDQESANSDYFMDALRKASGVWILGGRRLADAYLDPAVEREIKELLARGGVIGGSSAGATIRRERHSSCRVAM